MQSLNVSIYYFHNEMLQYNVNGLNNQYSLKAIARVSKVFCVFLGDRIVLDEFLLRL